MTLVAGIDCSTQSSKVVVCDAATGAVRRQGSASHPDATEVDPAVWWDAFSQAADGLLADVVAIAVGGQQHGMVVLDDDERVVRPALLWNDTRSAGAATDLVAELGGAAAWAQAVGSVPLASFTVAKLRWFAEHEPEGARRAAAVRLPHDWLTGRLAVDRAEATTDRGDASGTGYWSPHDGAYRTDLLARAFGRELALPRVAGPAEVVGQTSSGISVAPGTGDNMAAALGLGIGPGDVVVSLGTSGTAFAVSRQPTSDPSGAVAGFADGTGRFLPLVCTLNAARVLTAAASMLGTDLAGLDTLALAAEAGAGGLTLLPYLDGERTPDLPGARGLLAGITRTNATPENLARAAVEGMLSGLADGVDALRAAGVEPQRILLIGGASGSRAVRALAPALLGAPVELPDAGEYVARGAARQAAWAFSGADTAPDWTVPGVALDDGSVTGAMEVRERYAQVRDGALPLLGG